ncbi:MAG: hypothetical protein NVSMB28_21240 [Collimonas sp.]
MGTIAEIATETDKVVKSIASIEPTVAAVIGMFVPGAAPVVALVQPWAPMALNFLDRALQDVAASNGGDIMAAFIELMQHVSKGGPNSPALMPRKTQDDSTKESPAS